MTKIQNFIRNRFVHSELEFEIWDLKLDHGIWRNDKK